MYKLFELFTLGLFQLCIVRQGEVRVIEKRGRFARVAEPGVTLLFSLWGAGETIGRFTISEITRNQQGESYVRPRVNVDSISMRTQVDDYPAESVITKDNATVYIDAVVYYRIFDPAKAVYSVQDYALALQKLVQSALRDECGKYELDELLTSRDRINSNLRIALDEATDPWGMKVERVELKDIDLGQFGQVLAEQRASETKRRTEITEAEGAKRAAVLRAEGLADSSQKTAEAEKRNVILRAEAEKAATILRAEAEKEALLLKTEAQAQSMLRMRQAEAQGYAMVKQVLQGGGDSEALLRVLELQKAAETGQALAAGSSTKFFLPAELNNLFGFATPKKELK